MTRAEERALKEYPIVSAAADTHEMKMNRYLYGRAYREGERDTIERAFEWILDNISNYDTTINEEEFADDFRTAMEEG